ncbi:hypothetical protein PWT90_01936 [Aphanocladium album]|nr:hypothetical protein PWT90_01936 [Aphanocladium album]
MLALCVALLCFAPSVIGQEWLSDPRTNLRPNNITGLPYYIYRWTGSYYNGSTTIRIEPQEFEENTNKDTKVSYPVQVTYKNSILAIVKSNTYVEDQNEVTFSLRYWDSNLNIAPIFDIADGPINSIQNIDSVDMNRDSRPSGTQPPYWQLESSHDSETSYSFSGKRNFTVLQSLKFNCSECLSSSEFRGSIVNPLRRSGPDPLNVTSFPFVRGQFNNRSASLTITGTYVGGSRAESDRDNEVHLGGPITISFLGEIDELRSDTLLPSRNGTPLWNKTLGYTKSLYDNSGTAVWAESIVPSAFVLAAMTTFLNIDTTSNMVLSDREKNVFLARLNGQAGRYKVTKQILQKEIEAGIEPNPEEQKLLSIAYSKLQHALRDSWRVMLAVEQEEKAKEGSDLVSVIEEARKGVETELESLCDEVIHLVEEKITLSATSDETRLFCLKMKADYNRYIAECTAEDKRAAKTDLARAAYGDAIKLAQDKFDPGNPHRLSVMVNAAVFYHDFVNMEEHAIELTESELSKAMEAVADSTDADVRAIMNILHANLQLWKLDAEQ